VTVLDPVAALAVIVTVTGRLVAVPPAPIVAVTPVPLNVTAVAPERFVPAIVAENVVPCVPEDGAMEEMEGVAVVREKLPFVTPVSKSVPFDATLVSVVEPEEKLKVTFPVPVDNALNRIVASVAEAPPLEYFAPLEATWEKSICPAAVFTEFC